MRAIYHEFKFAKYGRSEAAGVTYVLTVRWGRSESEDGVSKPGLRA